MTRKKIRSARRQPKQSTRRTTQKRPAASPRKWSTRSNKVREMDETSPDRWRYLVYRDGKQIELSKEEYDALYRPSPEDQ
jgi:hypothetical protein